MTIIHDRKEPEPVWHSILVAVILLALLVACAVAFMFPMRP